LTSMGTRPCSTTRRGRLAKPARAPRAPTRAPCTSHPAAVAHLGTCVEGEAVVDLIGLLRSAGSSRPRGSRQMPDQRPVEPSLTVLDRDCLLRVLGDPPEASANCGRRFAPASTIRPASNSGAPECECVTVRRRRAGSPSPSMIPMGSIERRAPPRRRLPDLERSGPRGGARRSDPASGPTGHDVI